MECEKLEDMTCFRLHYKLNRRLIFGHTLAFGFVHTQAEELKEKVGNYKKKGGVAYLQEETSDGLRRQVAVGIVV